MRKFFTIIALAAGFTAAAQYRNPLDVLEDSETVRSLKEHVSMLSSASMEGRAPGSEGEKLAAGYLEEKLKDCGIDVLPGPFACGKDADKPLW